MRKILIAFLCFFLCSCEFLVTRNIGYKNTIVAEKSKSVLKTEIDNRDIENILLIPSNNYERVAMKIAGMFAEEKFLTDPTYIKYMEFLNKEWDRLSQESLSLIPLWSNCNINTRVKEIETVFYPFGGPDIAYVINFFPNSSRYILVGLERIGSFNEINKKLENPEVVPYLEEAIKSYLRGGYFITSEMVTHLSNNVLQGTLYMILLQLAKLNFQILDVQELSINHKGQEVPRCSKMISCVKIKCTKVGSKKEKIIDRKSVV